MLLLFPPGWPLGCGGPHIGLPLIKGFLDERQIACEIRDLNIEAAHELGVSVTEERVREVVSERDHNSSWRYHFATHDRLSQIASAFGGTWDLLTGFNFDGCDLSSSESVRSFSKEVSPFTELYQRKLLQQLASHRIVGFSATLPTQLLSSFEIARLIRATGYDGQLFLGGNAVTRLKEELEKDWIFDLFDGVILNQGEPALSALALERPFEEVPNLLWRNDGRYIYNGYTKLPPHAFSMPDFTGFEVGEYWGKNYLPAISARGCYYGRCGFCAIPYAWGNNGFLGFDEPSSVGRYLNRSAEKWGVTNFFFVDESMSPVQLKKIAEHVPAEEFSLQCYARFEKKWLSPDVLEAARRAGVKKLNLGLETISSDRSKMQKSDSVESIETYLERFRDYGIKTHLFVMVGYPGIDVRDATPTLDFLFQHEDLIDTVDFSGFTWSRHTTHSGILRVQQKEQDWALSFDYRADDDHTASPAEARAATRKTETIAINSVPRWTDPIYRLSSPWP